MALTPLPGSELVLIEDLNIFRIFCTKSLLLSEIHATSKKEALEYARVIAKDWPEVDAISPAVNSEEVFVTLCLTQNCNLSCKYCYVHSENSRWPCLPTQQSVVTPEFIENIIQVLVNNNYTKIGINLIGGEPLLSREPLIHIIEYLRRIESELGIAVGIGLTTNGTLLDHTFLDWAKDQQVDIMLSLDSPSKLHDLYRASNNPIASFRNILSNIEGFEEDLQVVTTITQQTPSIQDAISSLLDHGFKKVGFNLVHTTHPNLAIDQEKILHFQNEFRYQKKWYEIHSKKITNLIQIHTLLLNRTVKQSPCLSGKKVFALAPDGKKYFCHGAIGNAYYEVDDNCIPLNSELKEKIETATSINGCKSCWAKNLCGGDCWLIRWSYGNEIQELRCDFIQSFIALAILTFDHVK